MITTQTIHRQPCSAEIKHPSHSAAAAVVPTPPTTTAAAPRMGSVAKLTAPRRKSGATPALVPPPLPHVIHSKSIHAVMAQQLADIDLEECEAQGENAFFVCDLATVWRAHQRWLRMFSPTGPSSTQVEAFYAVKCNPDPTVISLLANMGLGFDCASQAEIELVLSLGISPDRIIYANPCKAASFVRHAASVGVQMMTFDNSDELTKVAKYHPSAKLVLRILTDDEGSLCRFGTKFGAALSRVRGLLQKAKQLHLDVVGVSFHVGSGCTNPQLYESAIASAKWVFGVAEEEGFRMHLLDIGGGFEGKTFDAIGSVARAAVDRHFPKSSGVRCIAEPGRFYVTDAFELATNIIARRGLTVEDTVTFDGGKVVEEEAPMVMYYINDGVYGAFNCLMFDHQEVHPKLLTLGGHLARSEAAGGERTTCSVWGPTCDSIDQVCKTTSLPADTLCVGDWLRWTSMGAYTICAASQFNGFHKSIVHYTVDDKGEPGVAQMVGKLVGH